MTKINIQLTGIGAELVLGKYMPKDQTIFNDWQDFYRYNDLIHEAELLSEHVAELLIRQDEEVIFKGIIPETKFQSQKSFMPKLFPLAIYLKTECAEYAVYQCEFEAEDFDPDKLFFETQDYGKLFKVGRSYITNMLYDNQKLQLEWVSGKRIGEACYICRCNEGDLEPIFDAIKRVEL